MMILVVGATGLLGGKVCRLLAGGQSHVRALVRTSAAPARIHELEALGVEMAFGDLKDMASLEAALVGVHTVVTTATATVSRGPGDSIETVDLSGQLHLLEAARRVGVDHFVYASFFPQALEFPLQTAKRTVERAIKDSGLAYTIVQPVNFMEVWLGPALGFEPAQGRARVLGDGTKAVSWVSVADVAELMARAVQNPAARNRIFPLGGAALSYADVLEAFSSLGAVAKDIDRISEANLLEQYEKAQDPLQRSIAALMLGTARGLVAPSDNAASMFGLKLKTIAEFAAEVTSAK